ncbi:sulfotransferase domain-containing protein [Thalassospira xiamenensis]|uniref:sulfotransferase domain-containing protein n=1 Tax=Thalassospira xiamenensis TaxID=220697 RepID=UPI003AA9B966
MVSLPNFICVGAPKTGTSALHEDMAVHPDIFLPKVKETHFFRLAFDGLPWNGPGTPPPMDVDSLQKYQALFANAKTEQAIGEICPSYFADPRTPDHIYNTLGRIKIIIVLRDPAARAFSQFLHARLIGCEPEPSFLKAIALEPERKSAQWGEFWSYLGQSHYAPVLDRYFSTFGRKNVLVLRHEHYVNKRQDSLRDVYNFIGVTPDIAQQQGVPKRQVNVSGIPRNRTAAFAFQHIEKMAAISRDVVPRPIRQKVRSLLDRSLEKATLLQEERHYILSRLSNDVAQVETLTGWDLSNWKVPVE